MAGKSNSKKRVNIERIFRNKGRSFKRAYSSIFLHSVDFRKKIKKEFPRSLVLIFVSVFIITSLGATYIISGGRPISGPSIAGASEDDLFYKLQPPLFPI